MRVHACRLKSFLYPNLRVSAYLSADCRPSGQLACLLWPPCSPRLSLWSVSGALALNIAELQDGVSFPTVASFQSEHYLAADCLAFLAACLPVLVSLLALLSRPLPLEAPDHGQRI